MGQKHDRPGDTDTPFPSEQPTFEEIREVLAERGQIAILWGVEDVQAVRPDLSREQSWEVLQRAEQRHDGDTGITFNSLGVEAEEMFPKYRQDLPDAAFDGDRTPSPEEWRQLKAEWSHDYGLRTPHDTGGKSPADLAEPLGSPMATPELLVTPADLMDSTAQAQNQETRPVGLDMPADSLANARDAIAETKNAIKDSPADIGREELGRLPTQDPARQYRGPKL